MCTQNPRWWRWSASSTSAGVFTPANGHPAACASGGDLGPGVREQPRVERGVEDLLGLRSHERVGAGERLRERVVVEDREHLRELLGCRHHRHVAVGAGEHAVGSSVSAVLARDAAAGRAPWYSHPRKRTARDGDGAERLVRAHSRRARRRRRHGRAATAASAPSAAVCPIVHSPTTPGTFTGTTSECPCGRRDPARPPARRGRTTCSPRRDPSCRTR